MCLLTVLVATGACARGVRATPDVSEAAGVAAASPLAVEAGLRVLRAGGSAVDAAVAVQVMLGLVEPQSSGIGGGAFLMHYEAASGRITVFDGRETAPAAATPLMLTDDAGGALPFNEAVISGRATGVPGVMPMLGVAHARFGRLPWRELFVSAIAAADTGFPVPPRLARFAGSGAIQARQPDVRALFSHADGTPVQHGELLKNPAYASTLRLLAARGPRALHEGELAAAIVARLAQEPRPGSMTTQDLANYQPVERAALCRPYRIYVVCVPPPPSSGVSLLQAIAMLERTDIAARGAADPQSWYLFAEASRLMYADRDAFVADPAFIAVPVDGLLDAAYVASRAALIGERAPTAYEAGSPGGAPPGPDATSEAAGTSHFIVIDARGNVVSMTTTVESIFGSGRSVGGFMLNNQMTDFSFLPTIDGRPVANAVAAGKRPRSSMAPAIILDRGGRFRAAIGSPGGSAILAYNAKTLVASLAWGLPMQEAIDLPNIVARGTRFNGEAARLSPSVREGLAARGVVVMPGEGEDSGLQGVILRERSRPDGGADSRRDGVWRALRPQ